MSKRLSLVSILSSALFFVTSCVPQKNSVFDLSSVYAIVTICSLFLLIGCIRTLRNTEPWFIVLFSSVLVVNTGYFILSVSTTLQMALWANRISYLGSVFLPLSMFFVILHVCKYPAKKWLIAVLSVISIAVFLIAASPGILDIYYKDVYLIQENGASFLVKEYGPWHSLYLYYLISYFGSMIGVVLVALAKKRLTATIHAWVILSAVFVNICVWLLEQLVDIRFEMLSISYIMSELFLIGIYVVIKYAEKSMLSCSTVNDNESCTNNTLTVIEPNEVDTTHDDKQRYFEFTENLKTLTPTEHTVFELYADGRSSKDILAKLGIKENTLKYHNKNIYSKLGVSSRKELLSLASLLNKHDSDDSNTSNPHMIK